MSAHNEWVESGQYRNSAEHSLKRDAQTLQKGDPKQIATRTTKPEHEGESENRDCSQHEGQEPVGELDESVDAHLRGVDQRVFSAQRPLRAT